MACSLFPCTSLVLYTFYPYSKIPQLNTIQTRALEILRNWAPLDDTLIAFHDPMPHNKPGVFFGVYIQILLLRCWGHTIEILTHYFFVFGSSFPQNSYSGE